MAEDRPKDALDEQQAMREHEREARERDPDERGPDSGPEPAEPAPPANVQEGTISGS